MTCSVEWHDDCASPDVAGRELVDPFELPGLSLPNAPVWDTAHGCTSTDVHGRKVLDLAMCFGTNLLGHGDGLHAILERWRDDDVPAAGLGDLNSTVLRHAANRALCELAGPLWGDGRAAGELAAVVLHTGSEAVETGIKTALRATGRRRVVAFEGGYHGTFGLALAATHRPEFREPFAALYDADAVEFAPYATVPHLDEDIACVVVEPVQGRAGVIVPPPGFLTELQAACERAGAMLIVDCVLTGCGRTGVPLDGAACNPHIACLGKALGSGVAASATVMRREVALAAWGAGTGEAIHTSTMLGEPLACAAILHTLEQLGTRIPDIIAAGDAWRAALDEAADHMRWELRGRGLLWALDSGRAGAGLALAQRLLDEQSLLVVPSGYDGRSITLYPSLACTDADRRRAAQALIATAGIMA